MFKGKLFLPLLLTFLVTCSAFAHNVEQFYADYDEGNTTLTIQFDVAYSIPDIRDAPSAPQPKYSWLIEQSLEEHATLRKEAEAYLRQYITFISEGEKIDFHVTFPDFDESPHSYVKLLNQGAYYRILLKPIGSKINNIQPQLIQPDSPKLLIARKSENDTTYTTIHPPAEQNTISSSPTSTLKPQDQSNQPPSAQRSNLLLIGFKHVIPNGLDHILFIIGISLTAITFRQLLWHSLIFTIAHALSMFLIISETLPIYSYSISNYIESFIALSITLIAIEVLFPRKLIRVNYVKYRYLTIAIFGLIHGCGFAGSLGSSLQSLNTSNWILPLIIANIGIELAQILLVFITYTILCYLRKKTSIKFTQRCSQLVALAIMATGVIWFMQRLP